MPVEVGKEAPDFSAEAYHQGTQKEVRLKDHRGRWVILIFYLRDFTPVWPTELAAVAVKYPAFRELGAEVLAVSVDSVDTHRKWQEEELVRMVAGGALFPLCSDPDGEIGKQYGVYDAGPREDLRATFIIDPEGKIQAMEVFPRVIGRNIPEILRILRSLQHYRATGNLLPCGWQPGKPTLTPDPGDRQKAARTCEIWETRNAF